MRQAISAGWHFRHPGLLFETAANDDGPRGHLHIMRLAPGEGTLTLDWIDFDPSADGRRSYELEYRKRHRPETAAVALPLETDGCRSGSATISGLTDGADYEVCIRATAESSDELACSPVRLFRPGHVPGTVVNYIHPEDDTYGFSGRSPASPSIVPLASGDLLASHDIFWGGAGQNTTVLFRSRDGDLTWSFLNFLYPCFWGKLFLHRGRLYMLATSTEYGALLIGRSDDGGETWSAPSGLMPAGNHDTGGPHKAPMPVIEHKGRLWTGIDYGSWFLGSL